MENPETLAVILTEAHAYEIMITALLNRCIMGVGRIGRYSLAAGIGTALAVNYIRRDGVGMLNMALNPKSHAFQITYKTRTVTIASKVRDLHTAVVNGISKFTTEKVVEKIRPMLLNTTELQSKLQKKLKETPSDP